MFRIPEKQIIVNDDSQVRLLEDDGTVYADNDVTASAGGFILEGFLNEVIWTTSGAAAGNTNRDAKMSYLSPWSGTDKMVKFTAAVGVVETTAFAITAVGGAKRGDTYRLVTDSLDLTPTEYQNRPTEKRYQLGVDCANPAAIVAALVAQINADPFAPVIAYPGFNNASPAQDDSNKIVLVGKPGFVGVKVDLFVGEYNVWDQTTYTVALAKSAVGATVYHTVEDTSVTTAAATLPVGTYNALKNINWAKNFDIDRDINWMPLPGASYNSYYFEVRSQGLAQQGGNTPSPNELANNQVYAVRLYVKSGLTLDSALTLLEVDVNT
jgi:hypothetical protein